MSDDNDDLPIGDIQFYDNFEPGLKDGTYQIAVKQDVSAPNASVQPISQTFIVQGPRFAIDASEIHTVFPPNGVIGQFEECLPHVALNKRLLPWERDIPGLSDAAPWLALLVFQEGELLGEPGGGNYAQTLTVADLLAADPKGQVLKPQLTAVSDDEKKMSCQAITIRSDLFSRIVPTAAELPYLTHARQVNTGDKVLFGMKDDGWFSVVVSNRFPQPGTAVNGAKNIVHLVSLEGFGAYLNAAAPVQPTLPQVQLVSLASWTFTCLADPAQTFSALATNLARDAAGNPRPTSSLMLRLAVDPPAAGSTGLAAAAQQRLADGYVALGYHAQTGEDAFAWYRGPLAPVIPNAVPKTGPFQTADAAMVYDPITGVFDHSLAAAWQIGRSLALADQSFAITLMRLRQTASRLLDQLAQQGGGSAVTSAQGAVHTRLAALFQSGVVQTIQQAATAGNLSPPARTPAASTPAHLQTLRSVLAQADTRAALEQHLAADTDTDAVTQWLGTVQLLYGVPFVHLAPDARMLPPESIRFFYLDPNWIGALTDGALSVGIGSSRDAEIQQAITDLLQQRAAAAAQAYRAALRGEQTPAPSAGPLAGILIRSALVSGWPGLAVRASGGGTPLTPKRIDHLGPNVLLCLFDGVPDTVVVAEPQEGIEFGVDDVGQITLRKITDPVGAPIGTLTIYNLQNPAAAMPTLRGDGLRVLNLNAGGNDLLSALAKALSVDRSALGPASFALQMVKAPEQVTFSGSTPP